MYCGGCFRDNALVTALRKLGHDTLMLPLYLPLTLDEADQSAAWVHAYLHRKEGDLANAAYWYRRAGRPMAREELKAEWLAIATALLGDM